MSDYGALDTDDEWEQGSWREVYGACHIDPDGHEEVDDATTARS